MRRGRIALRRRDGAPSSSSSFSARPLRRVESPVLGFTRRARGKARFTIHKTTRRIELSPLRARRHSCQSRVRHRAGGANLHNPVRVDDSNWRIVSISVAANICIRAALPPAALTPLPLPVLATPAGVSAAAAAAAAFPLCQQLVALLNFASGIPLSLRVSSRHPPPFYPFVPPLSLHPPVGSHLLSAFTLSYRYLHCESTRPQRRTINRCSYLISVST